MLKFTLTTLPTLQVVCAAVDAVNNTGKPLHSPSTIVVYHALLRKQKAVCKDLTALPDI